MKTYTYRITGIRPLLMHNAAAMDLNRTPDIAAAKVYDHKKEAEAATYRLADGQLCVLSVAFRNACIGKGGGALGLKIGKSSAAQRFCAGVFLVDDRCGLYHPKTKKGLRDYEIDVRRAVVGTAGVPRARPLIREWACDLRLEIDEAFITPAMVLTILYFVRRIAGVGDYRPQKKGMFGMFTAELVGDAK